MANTICRGARKIPANDSVSSGPMILYLTTSSGNTERRTGFGRKYTTANNMNISTVMYMFLSIFFIRVLLYRILIRTNVALFLRPYHLEFFLDITQPKNNGI